MEQSSFCDELTVRHQFDCLCKMALEGEVIDYQRHIAYRQKHEVMLAELTEKGLSRFFTMDEYDAGKYCFWVLGYEVEAKDTLIEETLQSLSERKRNMILLSYFMDMSDAEIAREMNLVRSTIHEHRKRSLELLKEIMKGCTNEKKINILTNLVCYLSILLFRYVETVCKLVRKYAILRAFGYEVQSICPPFATRKNKIDLK